jgi:two-component system cell cycle sensor histidine kinase/response regulator CckA
VLIVDDEPLLLKSTERLFESRGFEVLTATDATSALRVSGAAEALDLLVTDVFLPGSDGPALAAAICASRPGLPVLFISGLDAAAVGEGLPAGQRWAFLPKPFRTRELDACLAELLGSGVQSADTRRE